MGELAQGVKCLGHKHEDLFGFPVPTQKAGAVVRTSHLTRVGWGERILKALEPVSPRFNKGPVSRLMWSTPIINL